MSQVMLTDANRWMLSTDRQTKLSNVVINPERGTVANGLDHHLLQDFLLIGSLRRYPA
jgi:hypothetical protein